jgi:2'-5' RNA ligase
MRSFIAINLPDPIKSDIDSIVERLRPAGPPARWVPGSNFHLTLKFLDEISPEQVMPIRGAITMAVSNVGAFDIRLGGFGVFPNERKARVFWIGIEGGFETMQTLACDIDRAVAPLGVAQEAREFSAHVTLARFREPAPVGELVKATSHMPYRSEAIHVGSIELMKSVLSPKGAEYSILESVRLSTSAEGRGVA